MDGQVLTWMDEWISFVDEWMDKSHGMMDG
jgi:hypothetical protein